MSVPAFLSYPLADVYDVVEIDAGTSYENDAGSTRRRPRYRTVPRVPGVSNMPHEVTCTWLLTQAQFDEFDEFHEGEILVGAAGFPLGLEGFVQGTMFLEPPSVEVDSARTLFRVSGKLLRGGQRTAIEPEPIDEGIIVLGPLIASVPENDPTLFTVATLLSVVTSAAGGLHVVSVSAPAYGFVWLVGSEVVFEPYTERIGQAAFSYVVRDAANNEATVSARLTVYYRNESCIRLKLGNLNVTAPAGNALTFNMGDLGPYVPPPASGCIL